MKKIIIIFGVIFFLSLNLSIAEEFNFRKTKWGMNKDEVKKSEQTQDFVSEYEQLLIYKGNLSDFNVEIGYIFLSNKLVRAKYIITEKHTNDNDYIDDFSNLKKLLESKYGKSKGEDGQVWINDLYKNMPQDWGTAISIGHLVYSAEYETEETGIVILLKGDNYKIEHGIEYRSKLLQELEKNEKEKKALDDL